MKKIILLFLFVLSIQISGSIYANSEGAWVYNKVSDDESSDPTGISRILSTNFDYFKPLLVSAAADVLSGSYTKRVTWVKHEKGFFQWVGKTLCAPSNPKLKQAVESASYRLYPSTLVTEKASVQSGDPCKVVTSNPLVKMERNEIVE